jgi:hypothetical protein
LVSAASAKHRGVGLPIDNSTIIEKSAKYAPRDEAKSLHTEYPETTFTYARGRLFFDTPH